MYLLLIVILSDGMTSAGIDVCLVYAIHTIHS